MLNLSINADVKSSQTKTFLPKIRVGYLKNVYTEEVEIKSGVRKGTKQLSLCFEFREVEDSDRIYVHRMLPPEIKSEEDGKTAFEKYKASHETLTGNIKHIIEVYVKFSNVQDRFQNLATYEILFNTVVDVLKNQTRDGKGKITPNGHPLYLTENNKYITVWMKMVFQRNSSYISFPYSFDFIERVVENKQHNLKWNPQYDFDEPQKKSGTSTNAGASGLPATATEDMPEGW